MMYPDGSMIDDVVFRLNGWTICRLPDYHPIRGRNVFVHHNTCQQKKTRHTLDAGTKNEISWLKGEPPECWTCDEVIPEEIQALIHLHEWDKND